jgi:hypothetical protein
LNRRSETALFNKFTPTPTLPLRRGGSEHQPVHNLPFSEFAPISV